MTHDKLGGLLVTHLVVCIEMWYPCVLFEWFLNIFLLIICTRSVPDVERCPCCLCMFLVCGMLWVAVDQRRIQCLFYGPDIAARAKLIPVCNPSSEIEVQAAADRSQRQWFKGQNQQHSSLCKEDADRHTLMRNSWSVCGAIQTKAFIS